MAPQLGQLWCNGTAMVQRHSSRTGANNDLRVNAGAVAINAEPNIHACLQHRRDIYATATTAISLKPRSVSGRHHNQSQAASTISPQP